ncbi:MAG TPA: hypothetical protein VET65_11765 [Candidatus Limnocylindrales bacterium]|nr:hypothetical protein [Candidatus Limnocylindrales bacterium]
MTGAEVARQFLAHLGGVALVWVIAGGGVLAAMTAWRGRPAYWLGAFGALLIVFGFELAPGFLPSSVSTTAIGMGVVLAIFAIAVDLLLGPARVGTGSSDGEPVDTRFE